MEQTAVEFLISQLGIKLDGWNNDVIKEAKAMEKERMIEFTNDYVLTQCNASFEGNVSAELSAEEYYELTFKSE